MKSKIYLFVPINIGRNLESLLKRKAPNTEFITPASSLEERKYFEKIFAQPSQADLPELIVTLQPDILNYFKDEALREHFEGFSGENIGNTFPPLREDLKSLHFNSSLPYVKPLLFVPMIMLVNKDLKQPPQSWSDLFDSRFKGKILLPDIHTPVSVAFNALMKNETGASEEFFNRLKYSGLPFDVITGVNKGFYDVGILPLPFARYNMGKNLETIIPQEGCMVLPQMMFLRKNASEETRMVAQDLLGKNVQRFFSQLGSLIPAIEDIPLPVEVKNNTRFYWQDWSWYAKVMS